MNETQKPKLKLSDENGNTYSIIARAHRAARKANWTEAQIDKFTTEAMSGDYDNVLRTCMKCFDCS